MTYALASHALLCVARRNIYSTSLTLTHVGAVLMFSNGSGHVFGADVMEYGRVEQIE